MQEGRKPPKQTDSSEAWIQFVLIVLICFACSGCITEAERQRKQQAAAGSILCTHTHFNGIHTPINNNVVTQN